MKTITPQILALYLGQKCNYEVLMATLKWESRGESTITRKLLDDGNYRVKPILRKMESMTEEEAKEIWDASMPTKDYRHNNKERVLLSTKTVEQFAPLMLELLSRGFDLFNLIGSGLAVEGGEKQ